MTPCKTARLALVWLIAYVMLSMAAGKLLCDGTLHPTRRPLREADRTAARVLAAHQTASLRDISIRGFDGSELRAWLMVPEVSNGSAAILLHGLSDNRMGMMGYAELLLRHGFTVLVPDARAHGASSGDIATYGLLERNDIRDWFGWLEKTTHAECIDGFGESMGAAQILQAVAAEPGFCAIAAESTFSNFREIAYDRVGQFFHAGPWLGRSLFRPTIEAAFWWGRATYNLNLQEVSPQDAVAHSRVPILLIHGTDDKNIPFRHAGLIVSKNSGILMWSVAGADHCGAINVAKDFEQRLVRWFVDHNNEALHPATRDRARVFDPVD